MNVHFIHVGKTGGSAIKEALREAGLAVEGPESRYVQRAADVPSTPYGQIVLHNHPYRLRDVPPDDFAFFYLRDPISRFVSGFSSRLRKGQPRYFIEWTEEERLVFERFPTPRSLAHAIMSEDGEDRRLARWAMRHVQHLTRYKRPLGRPGQLRVSLSRVVYIGRQETLERDWRQLKSILTLPADLELPADPGAAHRGDYYSVDTDLDDTAVEILREWYALDYKLLNICERARARHGWGATSRARLARRLRRSYGGRLAGGLARRLGSRRSRP